MLIAVASSASTVTGFTLLEEDGECGKESPLEWCVEFDLDRGELGSVESPVLTVSGCTMMSSSSETVHSITEFSFS